MKKILILASKNSVNKERLTTYLKEYFEGRAEVFLRTFFDISIELRKRGVSVFVKDYDIRDFDLVYFRGTTGFMGRIKTLALVFDFLKIKYVDTVWGKASFLGDKLTSLTKLALSGFPIIESLFTSPENKKKIDDFVSRVGFPIMAKELTSQRLECVNIVKSLEHLKKLPKFRYGRKPEE